MREGLRYRNYVHTFILQCSDHVHEEIDNEVLGGFGYTEYFSCLCVLVENGEVDQTFSQRKEGGHISKRNSSLLNA